MANTDSKEIEIQVQIGKSKKLLGFLGENGKFIGEKHQIDEYFVPAHRDFISVRPVKEWLRLRNSSGKYSINYKNWHYDKKGKSHYCDEYETPIENLMEFEKIFKVLNIKSVVIVEKTRAIWLYQDYEIAIDSVKKLGKFVEIEYKGKASKKSPKKITDGMIDFLKKLNCGKITRNYVGYPFQLLFPNEVEFERY